MKGLSFTKQVKNLWYDLKAMRSGLPANQYELGRYQQMYGHLSDHVRQMFGHYDGASTNRLYSDWPTATGTPTANLSSAWKKLIGRSSKQIDNNPHAKAMIITMVDNAIGTGLRPKAKVETASGNEVKGINDALDEGWKRYNDEFDSTTHLTQYEAQRVRLEEMIKTGSSLTNRVESGVGTNLGIANQVLSVLRLDTSKDYTQDSFHTDPRIARTVFGINLDKNGAPVSYWIQGIEKPVPARNMDLHYRQNNAEEYIGVPWFANALKYLWASEKITEDMLIKSRLQAMIGLFIPDGLFNRLAKQQINSDAQMEMEPGRTYHGAKGDKPEVVQPDDSIKEVMEPLQRILLHGIAMTFGLSYMTVTRDVTRINMAAGKINTNQDRRIFRTIQKWFAKEVCQKDWNVYVERMFLEGKVPGRTIADYLADPWRFSQVQWIPNGFDFIDPSREAQAIDLMYGNKMTNLQEIYGAKGVDWLPALEQYAKEQNEMKRLKIVGAMPSDINKSRDAVANDPPNEQEEPAGR